MNINKVIYNDNILMDLTNDTISKQALLAGYTAHGANGEPIVGELEINTPTQTLIIDEEGTHNVLNYANANVDINWYKDDDYDLDDEWQRPSQWSPMANNYDKEQCLYFMCDTNLIPEDTRQNFSIYVTSNNKANMSLHKGYVDSQGQFQIQDTFVVKSSVVCTYEFTQSDKRFTTFKLIPASGSHLKTVSLCRPNSSGQGSSSFGAGATMVSQYSTYQPIIQTYGSLPYVTQFGDNWSSARRWAPYYLVHQDIKNVASLTSCVNMFYLCRNLQKVQFDGWNTTNCTNFGSMFYYCTMLKHIDLTNIKVTSKATTISNMFCGCMTVRQLDLSGWDTSSVTNFSSLFYYCYCLKSVDVSHFRGEKATNIQSMFSYCTKLPVIDLSNFSTSTLTTPMSSCFYNCYSVQKLDLRGLKMNESNSFQSTFQGCWNLKQLLLPSDFNPSKSTSFSGTFNNCLSLEEIDTSAWTNSLYTTCANMFKQCSRIKKIDLRGFVGTNCTNYSSMFQNCYRVQEILLPSTADFVTSKVTTLASMFDSCMRLKAIDVTNFNIQNVTTTASMFSYCQSLTSYGNIDNWNFAKCTTIASMFIACYNITQIPNWSSKTFPVLTTLTSVFAYCMSLKNVTLNDVSIPKVTTMTQMFQYCYSLKSIEISRLNAPLLTTIASMIANMHTLQYVTFKDWTAPKLNIATGLIYYCYQLKVMDINLNLSLCTSTQNFFSYSYSIQKIKSFPIMPALSFTINSALYLATAQEIVKVFQALPTASSKTITISSTNKNKLSSQQLAIATNKGWTVA